MISTVAGPASKSYLWRQRALHKKYVCATPCRASRGSPPHEGETKSALPTVILPLVRGRRERSERGGRSQRIFVESQDKEKVDDRNESFRWKTGVRRFCRGD